MSNTFQVVEIDSIQTIGISTPLTKSQHDNFGIISRLWKRFNAEIHKIRNRPSSMGDWKKFGITYAQNDEYFYLAAIPHMDNMLAPLDMIRKDIAQGQYAHFTHVGRMSHLKSTIYTIYKKVLPERNLTPEPQGKADVIHFEKYDNRFHWNRPDSIIEIYVPIETGAKKIVGEKMSQPSYDGDVSLNT